jgi:16S rRNA (uracil1498-N3)-methyltransferase
MHIFYTPDVNSDTYILNEEESKHCIRVLRFQKGSVLNLVDGKGGFYDAIVDEPHPKRTKINILRVQNNYGLRNYYLHIAIAPIKNIERLEWFLEKATEIGIDEITPIICEHSERKIYKIDRAEKIIQAATKQSNQYYLPKINEAITLNEFLKKNHSGQKFIAHCEETEKKSFANEIKKDNPVTILIGPEGDFSSKEINLAVENEFIPVTLGNTRLRTETAALVACHTIVIQNE